MGSLPARARALATLVSPRHRRYRRLLHSLDLDPDHLPRPLEPPGERDFIICGSPRSGTTLLSAMLFQPPSVVTVMEPWDGLRLAPAELFASLRREIADTGALSRGRLDVHALRRQGAVRWTREQEGVYDVEVDEGFLLGVKWPAFWRYLDLLPDTRFLVCVRHPYEVIGSYRKTTGRLTQGLDYDVAFNRRMNDWLLAATDDPAVRQVLLHDYVTLRLLAHLQRPNVFVVRYERWFTDSDRLLADIGAFLGAHLGAGAAAVSRRAPRSGLSADDRRVINEHCSTAEALGYSLDVDPEVAMDATG